MKLPGRAGHGLDFFLMFLQKQLNYLAMINNNSYISTYGWLESILMAIIKCLAGALSESKIRPSLRHK